VLTQAFNGAGDTTTPTLINLGCFWCFEIPLAYVLAVRLGFGPAGVFWAGAIGLSSLSIVCALFFRRGTWKAIRV
jgi:Na+-driven multidrug efflux pump